MGTPAQEYSPPNVPGFVYCINNFARQLYTDEAFDFNVSFVGGDINALAQGTYTVEVISVQFDNVIPNVSKYNNILSVLFNGVSYNTVFATANYNTTTLLSALNAFLATINNGLVASIDSVSLLMTITIPALSTFQFVRPIVGNSYDQNAFTFSVSANDRFLALLGYDPVEVGNKTYTGALSLVGQWPVNLYGTPFVDVCINTNIGCIHMGRKNLSIMTRVPITTSYGQVEFHEPANPPVFLIDKDVLCQWRLSLYDAWNELVDTVPKNANLSLKLKLRAAANF
jgi:hypothetical protein